MCYRSRSSPVSGKSTESICGSGVPVLGSAFRESVLVEIPCSRFGAFADCLHCRKREGEMSLAWCCAVTEMRLECNRHYGAGAWHARPVEHPSLPCRNSSKQLLSPLACKSLSLSAQRRHRVGVRHSLHSWREPCRVKVGCLVVRHHRGLLRRHFRQ
jgi:hypothetical protein